MRLIDELAKLPGIGRRSAERLAFHVLKTPTIEIVPLARAIGDVKERVRHCRVCFNLVDWGHKGAKPAAGPGVDVSGGAGIGGAASPAAALAEPPASEQGLCAICQDDRRDRSLVMVVEQPKDLIALEATGSFKGIFHVLMGRISPLDGVGPGDVTLRDLIERVAHPEANAGGVAIQEILLALNPTLEGDGTALYLADALSKVRPMGAGSVRVTRLARGVPTGSQLEYASKAVLADAIEGRKTL